MIMVISYCYYEDSILHPIDHLHIVYDLIILIIATLIMIKITITTILSKSEHQAMNRSIEVIEQVPWFDVIMVVGEDVIYLPSYYYDNFIFKIITAWGFSFGHLNYKSFNICLMMAVGRSLTVNIHSSFVTHLLSHLLEDALIVLMLKWYLHLKEKQIIEKCNNLDIGKIIKRMKRRALVVEEPVTEEHQIMCEMIMETDMIVTEGHEFSADAKLID